MDDNKLKEILKLWQMQKEALTASEWNFTRYQLRIKLVEMVCEGFALTTLESSHNSISMEAECELKS